jgi:hypothetical protein
MMIIHSYMMISSNMSYQDVVCWSLLGAYDHHRKITSYNVAKKYDLMTKFLRGINRKGFPTLKD